MVFGSIFIYFESQLVLDFMELHEPPLYLKIVSEIPILEYNEALF